MRRCEASDVRGILNNNASNFEALLKSYGRKREAFDNSGTKQKVLEIEDFLKYQKSII